MTNVAINGLGRIGRATMKIILEDSRFNLVAINTSFQLLIWPIFLNTTRSMGVGGKTSRPATWNCGSGMVASLFWAKEIQVAYHGGHWASIWSSSAPACSAGVRILGDISPLGHVL